MDHRTWLATAALLLAPGLGAAQNAPPRLPAPLCAPFGAPPAQPFAQVFVGASCVDLSSYLTTVTPGAYWTLLTPTLAVGGSQVAFSATFASSSAGTDVRFNSLSINGQPGPTTYAFLFGEPAPRGFYATSASAAGAFTLTNGAGGTAVVAPSAVYPTYLSAYVGRGRLPADAGVDLGSAPCTAAGAPGRVTTLCDLGSVTSDFAPTRTDSFDFLFTYTQTDVGSVVGFTNTPPSTTTTPEPSTLALVAAGVLAGASAVRRRSTA